MTGFIPAAELYNPLSFLGTYSFFPLLPCGLRLVLAFRDR